MKAIWTIARKEYQLAMRAVTTYIVFTLFLVISGAGFASAVFKIQLAELRSVYDIINLLFVFFIPAITMGSIAKERSSGTIELLSTLPIHLSDIVWGKILSAFWQVLTLLSFVLIYLGVIMVFGENIDYGVIVLGFLGLVMVALAYVSIGVFASSLSSNQVLAFVIALAISGFFYVIRYLLGLMPLRIVRYLQWFSFEYHLSGFLKGVLDVRDVLFFAAITLIFAFLATFKLQSQNMMQER
ncbi:MAG: gliding motility-associated transport system permease protein [Candidatus Cloacimonadota bacterium]|jgi:ABC-2 type transport system permease protein|nr:gliding motility-associated transport system permease protein [Candidatus Cloacimonadota bacterium]